MNHASNAAGAALTLLVQADEAAADDAAANNAAANNAAADNAASIELGGKRWRLAHYAHLSDAPPYMCVSYAWGCEKSPHLFDHAQTMSARTLAVLETAMRAVQSPDCLSNALAALSRSQERQAERLAAAIAGSHAIWIDALCVPHQPAVREACLRGMGAIYRSASQVIAVVSTPCSAVLQKIRHGQALDLADLTAADGDAWITRAWTYQEIAVSQTMFFAAEGDPTVLVNHLDYLGALVDGMTDYGKANQMVRKQLASAFPRLERMQTLLAGLQVGERPVFQVISAMRHRDAEADEERVYAMLGVVATAPPDDTAYLALEPVEHFLKICEDRGDFSFIFCSGPRSELAGRRWRPAGAQLTPVVSDLLATGTGLSACLKPSHLQMNNMCVMTPAANPLLNAIGAFLGRPFPAEIVDVLRQKGFTGSGDCLPLEQGYFFSQLPFKRAKGQLVACSHEVIFAQGAPAMLLRSNEAGIHEFCDVGVFIGRMSKDSVSIDVG